MPPNPAKLRRLRAEVVALRAELKDAQWLLRMESRLMREALDAASTVTLGYPNQPRNRGKFAPTGWTRPTKGGRKQAVAPVTVTYTHEAAQAHLTARIGHQLADHEVARLAGAHEPGSRVEVHRGSTLVLHGPGGAYTAHTYVQRSGPNDEHLVLFRFGKTARDGSERIAVNPRELAAQVNQARALGFTGISTKCRGVLGKAWQDTIILPRLGFDARIDAHLMEEAHHMRLPRGLEHAKTLSDVLAHPAGARWRAEAHLVTPSLHFDLSRGSYSLRTLDAYLRAHKLPPLEENPG